MTADDGTFGDSERMNPPSAEISAKTTDSTTTRAGDAVRRTAAAAGVMTSDITSSAPMICTHCATAAPSRTANTTDRVRVGSPSDSATTGSVLAKSSGRQMIAMTARTMAVVTATAIKPCDPTATT